MLHQLMLGAMVLSTVCATKPIDFSKLRQILVDQADKRLKDSPKRKVPVPCNTADTGSKSGGSMGMTTPRTYMYPEATTGAASRSAALQFSYQQDLPIGHTFKSQRTLEEIKHQMKSLEKM